MVLSIIPVSSIPILLPSVLIAYTVFYLIYNVFFHPLRSYPGPLLARATQIVHQSHILKGRPHVWISELHKQYGPVVRVAPNELSFIQPQAVKDILGYKSTGFTKNLVFYGKDTYGEPAGIFRADNVEHPRQRKLVSHAFSDRALREQEDILKTHVGTLVQQMEQIAKGRDNGVADMIKWYNFTTFDIMADLTFGRSLGQLSSSNYDPWVKGIFAFLKFTSITRVCREWPGLTTLLNALLPADIKKKKQTHIDFSAEEVDKRMARKTDRPDIWTFITKHNDGEGGGLSLDQLHSNGSLFMIAGTETTATELSGLTYLLCKHPEKLERLKKEIRGAFSSFEDIHMAELSQLSYLAACIDEGLRFYPPVPLGLPRIAPPEGAEVDGHWVAGGMTVQYSAYISSHSPTNFKNPLTFAPERFLPEGQEEYAFDKKEALNAFSYGPRACAGKSLAYHEMRLIMASLLLRFDIELCNPDEDWMDQDIHLVWVKKPLPVKLTLASKA